MPENEQVMEVDRTEYNWQAKVKSQVEALALTYGDVEFANVIFLVGKDKEEIFGHKDILFSRSVVLYNSFKGHFKRQFTTRNEKQYQIIEVPDMEPPEFRAFLKFLYTNQLGITPDLAMGVLFAAKFYIVPVLEELVREYVEKNLSVETIFMFYEQANVLKDDQVIDVCVHWIDDHTKEFIEAENFMKLNKQALCNILPRDQLLIQEVDLFKAVIRWAKFQCHSSSVYSTDKNMRAVLSDVLPLVRFPLMKQVEFSELEDIRILEKEELIQMIQYFGSGVPPSFSVTPREDPNASFIEKPNGEMIVRRFKSISSNDFVMDGKKWKASKTIELIGYGIYGSKSSSAAYVGEICDGPPSYCGEQGERQIVCQTSDGPVTFTFQDLYQGHTEKVLDYIVATGQVPEIIFRIKK